MKDLKPDFFPTVYDLVYYYVLMDRTTHTHTRTVSHPHPGNVPSVPVLFHSCCESALCHAPPLSLSLSLAFMLPPGCRSNWWHWLREERGLQQRTTLVSTHTHRTQIYANAQTNKHTCAMHRSLSLTHTHTYNTAWIHSYVQKCILWSSISNWLMQCCYIWRAIIRIDYRCCIWFWTNNYIQTLNPDVNISFHKPKMKRVFQKQNAGICPGTVLIDMGLRL